MKKKENQAYLKEQIITYLGNKRSLLSYIEKEVQIIQKKLKKTKTVNLDLFSGSGIVARLLKQYSEVLYVNDLERYSEIINSCYLSNKTEIDFILLDNAIIEINKIINQKQYKEGFISELYAPKDDNNIKDGDRVFYTRENALIIDSVRQYLDNVEEPVKTMLLGVLLSEASIKTNTAGIFKGFYKDSSTGRGKFGGNGEYALNRIKAKITIKTPVLSNFECKYKIFRENSNELVKSLKNLDIVYIDPPYNQHPYGSNYFMLNLISDYVKPNEISKISGIPKGWNKSSYNYKNKAYDEFSDLISNIDSSYIMVSYNSEGFITYENMLSLLTRFGTVEVKEIVYNTFRGSRNLSERNLYVNEYLFILRKEYNDEK